MSPGILPYSRPERHPQNLRAPLSEATCLRDAKEAGCVGGEQSCREVHERTLPEGDGVRRCSDDLVARVV
eukprot:3792766-Rhodomonas_salina.1